MKRYFSLLLALFMLFMSCKHDVKDKKDEEKPKVISKLTLKELSIYKVPVTENKTTKKKEVTLEEEQIEAGNIEAHFSYGDVSDKVLTVVVKDSPFVLDKTKPKTLHISVPAQEGLYEAWSETIEVSWKKGKEPSLDLITKASLVGSYEHGVQFAASKAQMEKLMKNEGLILEMKGPYAIMLFGSNKVTWTKCEVDKKELKFAADSHLGLKSYTYAGFELPHIGQTTEHTILVEAGEKKQEISFKIKRLEGTVDIPSLSLIVVASDVITDENLPKLFDGSRPQFKGTDPCHIEVRCAGDFVSSCVIAGSSPITMSKKTIGKEDIYYAEHSVSGVDKTTGKDVDILVKPKNQNDFHDTVWRFHLNYQEKISMNVVYTFNNKARRQLDQQFVKDLEEGKKPTLSLTNASFLNMKLDSKSKVNEVKINDVSFTGDVLVDKGAGTIFNHSFPITTGEKDIKIVLIPKDSGKYAEKVFEFKVKGDGKKEKLNPSLSINEETEFSDEFKTGLTNNSKPLHKVFKSPANIEILVDEYTYTFLTDTLKINDEEVKIIKEKQGLKTFYLAKKAIEVLDAQAKDVKIEFVPKKANIFEPLTWEFKLQGGAEKPPFPKDKISFFRIDGVGGFGDPLPKELLDNLTTSTPYTHTVDKEEVVVEVGWYEDVNNMLQHVIFEVDGTPTTVLATQKTNAFVCSHKVSLADPTEHAIKITMVPKQDENYKELVYSFKLKKSGQLPKLPIRFWVENFPILDGTQKDIETDMPVISVTSEEDNDEQIMDEVTINGSKIEIEKKKAVNGNGFFFEAATALGVSTTDYTDITISVTPKDVTKYRTTTCALKLKSKKSLPKNNGKFDFDAAGKQRVLYDVEWVDAQKREASNDHGAKSVVITFYTESPHAKVKYKNVFAGQDADGKNIFEADLTEFEDAKHLGTKHITKRIVLDQDKPITIKAEVVPDEGSTDAVKGIYDFTFNPVIVLWNYAKGTTHNSYTNVVKDMENVAGAKTPLIKVDRTQITGDKIYLCLSAWIDDYGCTVDTKGPVKFNKLDKDGDTQWYEAEIDVSSLKTQADEVEVSFPLLFNNKPSFTYKFKIKLQ